MRAITELLVLDEPVRPDAPTGLTAQTGLTAENSESAATSDCKGKAEVADWRVPIVTYLKDPGHGAERNIRRLAFKYILIDDELYCRTSEDVLLKCLDSDQARVAMGEVHEGICCTYQLAPKMKWLLRRAGFYWPTMMADCFRYYKECEEYHRFGNVQLVTAALLHPIIKPWPFRGWGWILLVRLIPLLQRDIASCWLLRITLLSGPKRFL